MASQNSKLLQEALAPMLKLAGFKKTSATWHRFGESEIVVVNVQGSQWGPQFYVNLGVYFRELGAKSKPCEAECHIRSRLDAHVPDRGRLNQLLDFDTGIGIEVRGKELAMLLERSGLPWLDYVSTKQGAKEWCEKHPRSPFAMDVLRDYLGLQVTRKDRLRLLDRIDGENVSGA